MIDYLLRKTYSAAVVIATLLAFPVFVPAQTWRAAQQLTATGRIHWSVGAISVLASTVASIAISLCGMFFIALAVGCVLIASGYSG